MKKKRIKSTISDIEVCISLDKRIGSWVGECPDGCEKIYAEWVFEDSDAYGYFYIDKNELRQGEFRSYYANGKLMFKCFYKNNNKFGLSYSYDLNENIEKIYFDNDIIDVSDERKYLAIHRLREI